MASNPDAWPVDTYKSVRKSFAAALSLSSASLEQKFDSTAIITLVLFLFGGKWTKYLDDLEQAQ